jgi:hypothetical protein
MDRRGTLTLAHRGVTHVRGKDCAHPDIGLAIVTMISFPARERRDNGRVCLCRRHRRERCSSWPFTGVTAWHALILPQKRSKSSASSLSDRSSTLSRSRKPRVATTSLTGLLFS